MQKEILPKQMLCLSVHDQETDRPCLLIERGPYVRDENRSPHCEHRLETLNVTDLCADEGFLQDLGFKLALVILREPARKNKWGEVKAAYIYPHVRGNNVVIRMDSYPVIRRPYVPDPARVFCARLPLPGLEREDIFQDALYCTLAEALLRHLPLDVADA